MACTLQAFPARDALRHEFEWLSKTVHFFDVYPIKEERDVLHTRTTVSVRPTHIV